MDDAIRKTGEIQMRIALGDQGENHEATCKVFRETIASAKSTDSDGASLHKATSVRLIIENPDAQKNFPIRIILNAESATRLAADILDWLAPRSLMPR